MPTGGSNGVFLSDKRLLLVLKYRSHSNNGNIHTVSYHKLSMFYKSGKVDQRKLSVQTNIYSVNELEKNEVSVELNID